MTSDDTHGNQQQKQGEEKNKRLLKRPIKIWKLTLPLWLAALAGCCILSVAIGGIGSLFEGAQELPTPTSVPTDTPIPAPTQTEAPTDTPAPTDTLAPTDTPQPTSIPTETPIPTDTPTPGPTDTPSPTNTPAPTDTPVPTPTPIVTTFSGTGDSVIEVNKTADPAIVDISYSGGGNFVVRNYGTDGEQIDLLVNTIGQYDGRRPLDFLQGEHTGRFAVESSGAWEIELLPLDSLRNIVVPTTFEGTGDDVVRISGSPDLMKVDATRATGNFAIWTYGDGINLAVNEIAPYDGVKLIDSETFVLVIQADGPWSIEITS